MVCKIDMIGYKQSVDSAATLSIVVNSSLFTHVRVSFNTGQSVTGRLDSQCLEVPCKETGAMFVSQVSLLKRGVGVTAEIVITKE